MKDSYLILDEEMRFLNCSSGGKEPGKSILGNLFLFLYPKKSSIDVGVVAALKESGFDNNMFHRRGGVYNWLRENEYDSVG